jgi:putative flippase GtrA
MNAALFESRFLRFGLAGVVATLVHVGVFLGLVEYAGLTPITASICAFTLATLFSYYINRALTFKTRGPHCTQLPKYALVAFAGLTLNILIIYVVIDVLRHWYGIALALVILIVPLGTFLLNRDWTFASGGSTHQEGRKKEMPLVLLRWGARWRCTVPKIGRHRSVLPSAQTGPDQSPGFVHVGGRVQKPGKT